MVVDHHCHCSNMCYYLPTASFDMKISVDGLFFIGSQLVALSYTGKVAVWQSMTQHWQVSYTDTGR